MISDQNQINGAGAFKKALAIVFAAITLLYDISPIDISPDVIPFVGWIDDIGITVVAALNFIQQMASDQNSFFVKMLKYIKWILVCIVVLLLLALGGLIVGIVALVKAL